MAELALDADHTFVLQQIGEGVLADFTTRPGFDPNNKPIIRADFLRRLMLGQIQGAVVLMPGVRICGVSLQGELDLTDCSGPGGLGLPALALYKCDLPDQIDLSGARIARLSLYESRFRELRGDGLKIDHDLNLDRASPMPVSNGEPEAYVTMPGARIGGNFSFRGGHLAHPDGRALDVEGARIGGSVELSSYEHHEHHRFVASGRINLSHTTIGGSLLCGGASLSSKRGPALDCTNAEINRDVKLGPAGSDYSFEAEGSVTFFGAKIGGLFLIKGCTFDHASKNNADDPDDALSLENATIGGTLLALENTIRGRAKLTGMKIGRLSDYPETAWDGARSVAFDETAYDHLAVADDMKRPLWRARAKLLRMGSRWNADQKKFSSHPWRECASAFARAGFHQDARRIAREEHREANRIRSWWKRPFIWFFAELLFGYGLSVTRSLVTSIVFLALGWAGAQMMLDRGALIDAKQTGAGAQPCVSIVAPLYALDTAIPFLDLRQESACDPGAAPESRLFAGLDVRHTGVRIPEEITLWRWAKTIYALLGALVIGFSVLIYTGVFKPKE